MLVFKGSGNLQNHQVKLHLNEAVKPIAEPPRTIPHHIQSSVQDVFEKMVSQNIIEE